MKQQAHHHSDRPPDHPRGTTLDVKTTFSLRQVRTRRTMITASIRPFQTKLSPSGECQHKLAEIRILLFPLSVSRRSFIHLHNPCDTLINNSSVICISMPEIEDRHSHSNYSPARNKISVGMRDLQGEG